MGNKNLLELSCLLEADKLIYVILRVSLSCCHLVKQWKVNLFLFLITPYLPPENLQPPLPVLACKKEKAVSFRKWKGVSPLCQTNIGDTTCGLEKKVLQWCSSHRENVTSYRCKGGSVYLKCYLRSIFQCGTAVNKHLVQYETCTGGSKVTFWKTLYSYLNYESRLDYCLFLTTYYVVSLEIQIREHKALWKGSSILISRREACPCPPSGKRWDDCEAKDV